MNQYFKGLKGQCHKIKLILLTYGESSVADPDPNPDPDPPDPPVRGIGMDPDPDPSIIMQK
jgi:hypothetical protein